MPQTDYSQAFKAGRAGLAQDSPDRVISAAADETVRFGIPVVSKTSDRSVCKAPRATQCVVLDDAGTWTAGDVVATVNGVSTTVSFDTDKATSMAAIATALQALSFIESATYASGSNTITIVAEQDVDLTGVAFDVTGITGDMTITSYTYTNAETLLGLSLFDDSLPYGTARQGALQDKAVMTLSGDAITTSDTVDGYVNGVAIDQVTYATSEAVTLQLVANAIMEIPGVDNAVVNSTARTITVTMRPGKELVMSLTVTDDTLASVAPTFAAAYSQQAMPITESEAAYLPGEAVGIVRKGIVFCRCEEAIALGDTPYVRVHASATQSTIGALRNDDDSGTAEAISGLAFWGASTQDPDGNLVVPVEVNLP